MEREYVPPEDGKEAFHCPFPECGVYASQRWSVIETPLFRGNPGGLFQACKCEHCSRISLWVEGHLVYPEATPAPAPNTDMPEDVLQLYQEAAAILGWSSRGAAALLRTAIEHLCENLEGGNGNLNQMIGSLVKRGLPVRIQQALDAVRVIGNEAVHPGQIDVDDYATAIQLFNLTNFITERMITQEREIEEIYQGLPEGKRQGIEQRDAQSSGS